MARPPKPLVTTDESDVEQPSGAPRSRAENSQSLLEERIRQGMGSFNFDALIDSATRASSPAGEGGPQLEVNRPWRLRAQRVCARIIRWLSAAFDSPRWLFSFLLGGIRAALRVMRRRSVVRVGLVAATAGALFVGLRAYADWSSTGRVGRLILGINPNVLRGLPDPILTPGERKRSSKPEPVPIEVRRNVFSAYGIDPHDEEFVPVRLVPATLGGSGSSLNVFPGSPLYARWKERLDARIAQLVARGKLTRSEAIHELKVDWVLAAIRHGVQNEAKRMQSEERGLDREAAAKNTNKRRI